jgi:tetratricopeptide (TPR) repeat protein
MAQKQITVENMTPEEHKKLDRKANIALLVVIVMFGFAALFLHSLYKKINTSQGGSSSNRQAGQGGNPQANAQPGTSQINKPELDKLMAEGKYIEASEKINTALNASPDDFNANLAMGILYQRQGILDKAAKYLEKASRLNSSDAYCSQVVGQFYIVADPVKAVSYYKDLNKIKNLAGDFSSDQLRSLLRAAYTAKNPVGKSSYLKEAENLIKKISIKDAGRSYNFILMQTESAFLQDDHKTALSFIGEIPTDSRNNLTFTDKYTAMILLGLLNAHSGDSVKATEAFSQSAKMLDNWQEPIFDRYIPRTEQLVMLKHVILNQPFDSEMLKKNTEKLRQLENMGIIPPDGAEEISVLMKDLCEADKKGSYEKAIKSAAELKGILTDYRTFYTDEDITIPVFAGCLDIYTGDLYKTTENKKKAEDYYRKAMNGSPVVKKIAEERLAKL